MLAKKLLIYTHQTKEKQPHYFHYPQTISLPNNTHNKPRYDKLIKLGIPIIQTTSQTIKNLTNISKQTKHVTNITSVKPNTI